ncbi:pentapeptide repeat-containing protein [Demequina pelophila]|uniref:pentapeptide repeat-containing protein n=1 Tax=Demequina pelophila TaxID=1638984 RepID=UPI000785352C|nr:hypothetical protein [Demequina pelophila]
MDSRVLEPGGPEDLGEGGLLEYLHFDGLEFGDVDVDGAELSECMFSDTVAGECRFTSLRMSATRYVGCSVTKLEMPGATIFGGGYKGVRVGALLADRADMSVFTIEDSRIDVLSIRDARVRRVEIKDSRIGLLDLTNSRLREVVVTGGRIEELIPSRGRIDGFDISATRVDRITDVAALKGVTISAAQAAEHARDLAEHLGAIVVD